MAKGQKIHYSAEELAFIKANKTISRAELTKKFNEKFKRNLKQTNIESLCKRNGWYTGRTGRIEKGNKPWNKGQTGLKINGSEKGWFSKGNRPENALPVGTEILSDGWVKVKVAEPNDWKAKARIVWEEHHGDIPDGKVVFHIDSDPTNNTIENLTLISRAELAQLNRNGFHQEPNELRPVIITHQKIKQKIREVQHENSN